VGPTKKLRRAISAHLEVEAFHQHLPDLFVYLRERESVDFEAPLPRNE